MSVVSATPATRKRPETFTCSWCGRSKALKRTGRMPRFCSDACRRAPITAESALQNARYHLQSAQRTIAYYEEHLERFRALEDAKTGSSGARGAETGSGVAIAAETRAS